MSSTQIFYVRGFKNPVAPITMTGFSVINTDDLGFAIGESGDVSLSGITEPTTFKYVEF